MKSRGEEEERRRAAKLQRYHETILGLHTNARLLDEGSAVNGMRETMRSAAAALEVSRASVWFLYDDRLVCEELFELTENRHSSGMVLMANDYPNYFKAIRTQRAIDANDARTDSRTREFREGYLEPLSITSMLDAAIWKEGTVRGVVCFEQTGTPRVWTPDDVTFAGEIADFISVVLLQSEQKQGEEALRESERRYKLLFESAGDAIFLMRDSLFVDCNPRTLEIFGCSRDQIIGETPYHFSPPLQADGRDSEEKALELIASVLDGTPQVFEWKHIRADGTPFDAEVSLNRVDLSSGIHIQAMVRDITERKRAEDELKQHRAHLEDMVAARTSELSAANKKLLELDRLKSMFIASVSHELRTPLNSIIGFTGMTLQGMSGELNDEQKDNLTRAYLSAKHLLNLITDVIDITKIEAGRVEAYPEEVFLRTLIDDAVAAVEPQLKEKGLILRVDVPADVNLTTDRKRLLQCLINFLSNAVKFTEAGTITIASRCTDAQVSVSVTDTGIGIAEKEMPRLFEPFERLETHLQVKAGGTGLGLYLTKKLAIEVLHGDVSVESLEGRGSTFTIRIPKDIRQAHSAPTEQNGGGIL
jgi:PAS domain S-box-containing protein